MNDKRFKLVLALASGTALLLLGAWLFSTPHSSTADELFPFYSPITPIGDPQIELAKSVSDDNPAVGDEIVYTLTYANTNPGSQAFNVRLYDFLPAGVRLEGADTGYTYQDGALLFDMGSVGPGTEEVEVNIVVSVLEGYEELLNHALFVADGVVPVHHSLATNVTQPPTQLRLVKTGYSTVLVDDALVYTLLCQNTGDTTADDVVLIDVLPTGLPHVAASPPPDEVTLPVLSWSLGDLAPGERRTVVVTTTAPASAGVITNTALLDARQKVVTQTVWATQVISQGAILRVTKTGSTPIVNVGDELVYTLRYENAGNEVATGVRLTDTFPADISVNAANPTTPDLTDQQGVWDLPDLNADDWGQIVITTTVGGQTDRTLLNVADVTAQPGSFPGHVELETDVRSTLMYLPIMIVVAVD